MAVSTQAEVGPLKSSVIGVSAKAPFDVVRRWQQLVYLAAGLSLLLLTLLVVALLLAHSRQQMSLRLQPTLLPLTLQYQADLTVAAKQIVHWQTKQKAMRHWLLGRQAAQLPQQLILQAQTLAQATGGMVDRLVWQNGHLQIHLRSRLAWQAIHLGLLSQPWASLARVQQVQDDPHAVAWYLYQVSYEPENSKAQRR